VVDLEGEDADEVFAALSSDTARAIVAALHEEPRTQSAIAEELDTTVQNVRYHLDKLENAGLVEVVDTWYSSRGNEMSVYAPADGALIVSGDRREASRLRTALSRLIGGVGVLGLAGLLVQSLFGEGSLFGGGGEDARAGAAGASADDGAAPSLAETTQATRGGDGVEVAAANGTNETVTQAAEATTTAVDPATTDAATSAAAGLPPGLLFFLGGLSVLVVVVGLAYWGGR
jgi:DNA-binding transcriptional ArsR family regulator